MKREDEKFSKSVFRKIKKKVKKRKVYEQKCCTTFPSSFSLHNFCTKTNFFPQTQRSAQQQTRRDEGKKSDYRRGNCECQIKFFSEDDDTTHVYNNKRLAVLASPAMQRPESSVRPQQREVGPRKKSRIFSSIAHFSLERFQVVAVCVVCSVIIV